RHPAKLLVGGTAIAKMRRQSRSSRETVEIGNRKLWREVCLQVTMHLDGKQRMATEIEEIVVDANRLQPQHALERVGDVLFRIPADRSTGRSRRLGLDPRARLLRTR